MHPVMTEKLAAQRIREMVAQGDDARHARHARRARRATTAGPGRPTLTSQPGLLRTQPQPGQHAAGEGLADEEVLVEYSFVPGAGGAGGLGALARLWRRFRPGDRLDGVIHERDAQDPSGMSGRTAEGEHASPVVAGQEHAVEAEGVEPGIEVAGGR